MKVTSQLALQKAAQAWCRPETSNIEMDTVLCSAFAEILDEYIVALKRIQEVGHNDDCLFCGFKDKIVKEHV